MKIEDQVTSLELSKQLKELGVCFINKQKSLFQWYSRLQKGETPFVSDRLRTPEIASALTVAELGQLLKHCLFNSGASTKSGWCATFDQHFTGDTEANARAKALIWLIENKHLDPKDL